jgi:hypothetical protein
LHISRSKNSSLINQLRKQFTGRRAKEQDSVAKRRTEIISIPNPKGIESFSPALADEIGLRWVTKQNGGNPERVESIWRERRCNPFRVGNFSGREPRVVAARQPWAE